jgi:hypothetical protein
MADVLGSQPFTVSLANKCLDRPALTIDERTRKFFLAWTALDRSINVMSSDDGLVFAERTQLPGRSVFGPAITGVNGTPVVLWTDADTGKLKIMNALNAPVSSFPSDEQAETSSAGPALAFLPEFVDKPHIVAWTGTNAERQLNVNALGVKTTLPSDGSNAATSTSGPSIAFKTGPDGAGFLVMGWTGLPGGPDHDNHLNIIFSDNFQIFGQRVTFAPTSNVGPAIVDVTRAADGNMFIAWADRQSQINTAHSNQLQVISA